MALKLMDIVWDIIRQIPGGNKIILIQSKTKQMFILIQIVPVHVCSMFRPVLRPSSGFSIQNPKNGDTVRI
jgi:hypothetical protein